MEKLIESEKRSLLSLARASIRHLEAPDTETLLKQLWGSHALTTALTRPQPCFVTLTQPNGRLRGCLGCLETDQPLYRNVHYFARRAALNDPRFPPVTAAEVPSLNVHIAVLGSPVAVDSPDKVKLGYQGLSVTDGHRRGVLLASVPIEWGWDTQEFIRQTCLKAGLPPGNSATYQWSVFDEESFGENDF